MEATILQPVDSEVNRLGHALLAQHGRAVANTSYLLCCGKAFVCMRCYIKRKFKNIVAAADFQSPRF